MGLRRGHLKGATSRVPLSELDGRRADPTSFSVLGQIPICIRYTSRFCAGHAALDPRELEPPRTNAMVLARKSVFAGNDDSTSMFEGEKIDLRLARFALGPQNPHLRIDLTVE